MCKLLYKRNSISFNFVFLQDFDFKNAEIYVLFRNTNIS